MTSPFRIETLDSAHGRSDFICGIEALDRYFREQAAQDMRRRITACYVAVDIANSKVAGFYTLSAAGIPLADFPSTIVKRLPRYPSVPVAKIGRLAVDQNYQGRKLGRTLLWDAISRGIRSEIAVFALIVDAMDERAEAFYRHHGFHRLSNESRQLVLPLFKLGK